MISISHWGVFDAPEPNWLDRGDGLPGFFSWSGMREAAIANLREWNRRNQAELALTDLVRRTLPH